MNIRQQDCLESIEDLFKELKAMGGAEDEAVKHELRRLLGDFTNMGRVGTLNLPGQSTWRPTRRR